VTEKIYVHDVGTVVELECGQDMTLAENPAILVRRPDGTARTWAAEAEGTRLRYVTRQGDLSIPGVHRLQAAFAQGVFHGRGATVELMVHRAFA
jgi:hypothetical protein